MSRLLATLFALSLLLTACGGGDDPAMDAGTSEAATTGTATDDAQSPSAEATLMVATTGHGDTVVDGSGRAVYLFDNDSAGASSCDDQCAQSWPPLAVEGAPVAGDGIDAAQLGTIERTDGVMQVTYAGHPLYHFAGDENPGDVNGHGLNEVWWLVRPDGSAMPANEVGMGY